MLQGWGKLADRTHRFKQSCDRPIDNPYTHGNSESSHGAPRSDQKAKGRSEQHDDGGNQWKSKFFLPLHGNRAVSNPAWRKPAMYSPSCLQFIW